MGVLDEAVLGDFLLESVPRYEVVFAAVLFALARGAGGVGDGEAEAVGVFLEKALEEGGFTGA